MARVNIDELTDEELRATYPRLVFKPVYAETPAIPSIMDGQYAQMLVVASNIQLSEAQMDQLEQAISDLPGISIAYTIVGSARIPLDRVPSNHNLKIWLNAGFTIEKP